MIDYTEAFPSLVCLMTHFDVRGCEGGWHKKVEIGLKHLAARDFMFKKYIYSFPRLESLTCEVEDLYYIPLPSKKLVVYGGIISWKQLPSTIEYLRSKVTFKGYNKIGRPMFPHLETVMLTGWGDCYRWNRDQEPFLDFMQDQRSVTKNFEIWMRVRNTIIPLLSHLPYVESLTIKTYGRNIVEAVRDNVAQFCPMITYLSIKLTIQERYASVFHPFIPLIPQGLTNLTVESDDILIDFCYSREWMTEILKAVRSGNPKQIVLKSVTPPYSRDWITAFQTAAGNDLQIIVSNERKLWERDITISLRETD